MMAYGSWDALIEEYETVYLHSKYAEHAKAMLNLIPELSADGRFDRLIPISSHATLVLRTPDKQSNVCVWYEGSGQYNIRLYDGKREKELDKILVPRDKVVTTLIDFVERGANSG